MDKSDNNQTVRNIGQKVLRSGGGTGGGGWGGGGGGLS